MKTRNLVLAIALVLGACSASTVMAGGPAAQMPDFVYQGKIEQNGLPVDGNVNLTFSLWNDQSGGTQFGSTISEPNYPVVDGVFSINLAFPGGFTGTQMYIEVGVNGSTLPRQPVATAPVAQFALNGVPGAQGPAGPAGPAGAQGPIGATGVTGADGAQGPIGVTGATGADGAQGPIGVTGATGADGAQGPIGVMGATGADGAQGPQGDVGQTGPQGLVGATGATGATGADGTQGPIGAMGAAGAQGPQGNDGPIGPQGLAGADGATGPAGANGLDGAPGVAGPQGPAGPTGPAGPQGPIGAIGPAGATGSQGPIGPIGPQGTTGSNGLDGTPGPAGPQGPAGPSGTLVPFFGSSYFASNATRYIGIGESDATDVKVAIPVPVSGTIGGLQVKTSGTPNNGGGTQSYTFSIFVNGTATAVTCVISESAQSCSNLSNSVAVSAGDRVSLQSMPSASTPTAVSSTWSFYISQ